MLRLIHLNWGYVALAIGLLGLWVVIVGALVYRAHQRDKRRERISRIGVDDAC